MTFIGLGQLDRYVPGDAICAAGIVPDVRYGTKFGRNEDVDGEEDIISTGGVYLGHPLNGLSVLGVEENFQVSSDNANDAVSGTGAQVVTITYLDDDGNWSEASIDMGGLSDVKMRVEAISATNTDIAGQFQYLILKQ